MDEIINLQSAYKKRRRLIRSMLEIKASPIHGYGIFADQIIYPGEVIEECPIILLESTPHTAFHAFKWDENYAHLPLGYGAIYNHSKQPNAVHSLDKENKLLRIIALKLIYRGDEIFINYGNNWFKEHNIQDLTDPSAKPITKNNWESKRILRFMFLSLILLFIYIFPPIISKPNATSNKAAPNNISQQINSIHSENLFPFPNK